MEHRLCGLTGKVIRICGFSPLYLALFIAWLISQSHVRKCKHLVLYSTRDSVVDTAHHT